jgi:hypothetical protein
VLGGGRRRRRRGGRDGGGCKGGKEMRQPLPCSKIDCMAEVGTFASRVGRKKKRAALPWGFCGAAGTNVASCSEGVVVVAASWRHRVPRQCAAAAAPSSSEYDDCIIIIIQSAHIHAANASQRNLNLGVHTHACDSTPCSTPLTWRPPQEQSSHPSRHRGNQPTWAQPVAAGFGRCGSRSRRAARADVAHVACQTSRASE